MLAEQEDALVDALPDTRPAELRPARVQAPGVVGLVAMGLLLPALTGLAWLLTGRLVPELAVFGLGALAVGAVAHQRVQADSAGDQSAGMSSAK